MTETRRLKAKKPLKKLLKNTMTETHFLNKRFSIFIKIEEFKNDPLKFYKILDYLLIALYLDHKT